MGRRVIRKKAIVERKRGKKGGEGEVPQLGS